MVERSWQRHACNNLARIQHEQAPACVALDGNFLTSSNNNRARSPADNLDSAELAETQHSEAFNEIEVVGYNIHTVYKKY